MNTYRATGTREVNSVILFEDSMVFIEYPTSTTWQADIVLELDRTEYNYRFRRYDGTYTPYKTITVSMGEQDVFSHSAFNTLDRWGIRFDTKRITGESNSSYKERLKDVFVHRGSSTFEGLVNSIARDFDLQYNDRALIINRGINPSTGQPFQFVAFEITSTKVYVSVPEFFIEKEEHLVQNSLLISPQFNIFSQLLITDSNELEVEYEYDEIKNQIRLLENIPGQVVNLSYFYRVSVSRMNKTITQLVSELHAIETDSTPILDITIASGYGSFTAEKLSMTAETLLFETHFDAANVEVDGLPVRWTDLYLVPVWDREFQEFIREWSGSLWGTKVDSVHLATEKLGKNSWGTAVADESLWSSLEIPLHGGQYIDVIYDPPLGYWEDHLGNIYDRWEILSGQVCLASYKGITRGLFQSGPAGEVDLKVSLGVTPADRKPGESLTGQTASSWSFAIPEGDLPTEGGIELP